jgi:hypothetical protein
MPIGKLTELENSMSAPTENHRGTFRSRSTGPHLPGAPEVELLRDIRAIEHAWWGFIASEYDGDFLDRHCLDLHIVIYLLESGNLFK